MHINFNKAQVTGVSQPTPEGGPKAETRSTVIYGGRKIAHVRTYDEKSAIGKIKAAFGFAEKCEVNTDGGQKQFVYVNKSSLITRVRAQEAVDRLMDKYMDPNPRFSGMLKEEYGRMNSNKEQLKTLHKDVKELCKALKVLSEDPVTNKAKIDKIMIFFNKVKPNTKHVSLGSTTNLKERKKIEQEIDNTLSKLPGHQLY